MKILGIDHIGLAVKSFGPAERFYQEILGLEELRQDEVPACGLRAKFLRLGDASLELMEPLGEHGPVQQHLKHLGPGVQHIALRVADFSETLAELREAKVWLVGDPEVRGGRRVCFVHPVVAGGVVLELVEAGESE